MRSILDAVLASVFLLFLGWVIAASAPHPKAARSDLTVRYCNHPGAPGMLGFGSFEPCQDVDPDVVPL